MAHLSETDKNHLRLLVTPSWLSGLVAVAAGAVITCGVIIAFSLHTSSVQQQLIAWQLNKPQRALTTPDQVLAENDHPGLGESWPLIIIWAGAGLAVYFVATAIVRSIRNAAILHESLDYVNAKPQELMKETVEHVAMRLLAIVLLGLLILGFIKKILPYSITAAHAAASDLLSAGGILYALLAFAVVVISLHLATILLRLVAGQVRLNT